MARVPFGEWLPDQASLGNPGMTALKNAIPRPSSYTQANALAPFTGPLDSICLGANAFRDTQGNAFVFAGTKTKLYQLAAGGWTDVSKAGGYSTATGEHWRFAQFGNQVIAVNFTNPDQVITLGATQFADLQTSGGVASAYAPQARYVAVIRGFVVMANTNDQDGNVPQRVRWSGIENPTLWTYDPVNQSDWQNLVGEGGWNQGIVGGEFGLVFQEKSIWRMTYVGSPNIFQLDQVEKNRGTPAPGSIAALGRMVFYLSDDGFYVTDGNSSQPIGNNKIDRTFLADADGSYYYQMSSAIDPIRKMVYWAYCGSGHSGYPNRVMVYNWSADRWGEMETPAEYIFSALTPALTIDTADPTIVQPDTGPFANYPIDSRFFANGRYAFGAFDSNHKFGNFSGPALAATLETTEVELNPGFTTMVNRVRALVDGTSPTTAVTAAVAKRMRQIDTPLPYGPDYPAQPTDWIGLRGNSRYHRFRMTLSGGFNNALGFEVEGTKMGIR